MESRFEALAHFHTSLDPEASQRWELKRGSVLFLKETLLRYPFLHNLV